MWTMLFLLWTIPSAIGVIAFAKVKDGIPAFNDNQRKVLFDETKETEFGPWLGLTFAGLAGVFFMLGLLQGIILPNLGLFWFVIIPLLTGTAAVLILGRWLRSAPPRSQGFQDAISRLQTRANRIAESLFG